MSATNGAPHTERQAPYDRVRSMARTIAEKLHDGTWSEEDVALVCLGVSMDRLVIEDKAWDHGEFIERVIDEIEEITGPLDESQWWADRNGQSPSSIVLNEARGFTP